MVVPTCLGLAVRNWLGMKLCHSVCALVTPQFGWHIQLCHSDLPLLLGPLDQEACASLCCLAISVLWSCSIWFISVCRLAHHTVLAFPPRFKTFLHALYVSGDLCKYCWHLTQTQQSGLCAYYESIRDRLWCQIPQLVNNGAGVSPLV